MLCGMAQAYSDDLRKKLLKAYVAGQGTLRELAARFDVSVAWAWKISSAHKKSGSMERKPQARYGRVSRIDPEQVKRLLDAQPDLTLEALKGALARVGVVASPTQLWRVLGRLGYRLKKSRSTRPSATPKRTVKSVRSSSSAWARSRRTA